MTINPIVNHNAARIGLKRRFRQNRYRKSGVVKKTLIAILLFSISATGVTKLEAEYRYPRHHQNRRHRRIDNVILAIEDDDVGV